MTETTDQGFLEEVCALPPGPIASVEMLREHLQFAIELEHALLPPYLCALWSLDPRANPEAAALVSGVAVEEMFHMGAVANILNAVGGRPAIDLPEMLPGYPRPLPHTDESFEIELLPFGNATLDAFLQVEHAGTSEVEGEPRCFDTVGHFYASIDRALVALCGELGEQAVFSGDPARQVRGGGRLPEIVDLTSARAALAAIVEQGEGRPWTGPGWAASVESAHYHRFLELKRGHRYAEGDTPESGPTGAPIAIRTDAIRVMRANPRLADHEPGTDVRVAQEQFNQQYCALLALLERVFDGEGGLLAESVRAMHRLGAHGEALMEIDDPGTPYVAGPTFEYVPRADRR